jgi:hypothetical protein
MENCPEKLLEKVFEKLSPEDVKILMLTSKRIYNVISTSMPLMRKFQLNLDNNKENRLDVFENQRKYSNIMVSNGGNSMSFIDMTIISNIRDFVRNLTFHKCNFTFDDYQYVFTIIGPHIKTITFAASGTPMSRFKHLKIQNQEIIKEEKIKAIQEIEMPELKTIRLHNSHLYHGKNIPAKVA